ncbi:hypothetical protein K7432_011262 [Basidiobolus ranarum]|uniref:Uncharacterized protein n=1 Tax=Basidiobolus ranarum TaxID=34480 RepID=A0ABR2VU57_9FUNG
MVLSTTPREQSIPPRTSSMLGTGIIEIDDASGSFTTRPISTAERYHQDSPSVSPHQAAVPVGILSRHILQKKHLRQQLLLHVAAETLIITGTITILKQITVFSWVIWVVIAFVLLVLFPFQLWVIMKKFRASIKNLDAKLQTELNAYLTLIRTHTRTGNEEYEYDPLHLDPPPPTYAVANKQPPLYLLLPNGEIGSQMPRISSGNLGSEHLADRTTINIPQIALENNSPNSDFRPPSYRSTDSNGNMSVQEHNQVAIVIS